MKSLTLERVGVGNAAIETLAPVRGPDSPLAHLLRLYGNSKDIEAGKCVHRYIVSRGLEKEVALADYLVEFYIQCGKLEEAHEVFSQMPIHGVISWSRMIWGYVQCRKYERAINLYRKMLQEGTTPEKLTLVNVLGACREAACLQFGKQIHSEIFIMGLQCDIIVCNSLINMYGNCGSLKNAFRVFKKMEERNQVSWNMIIAANTKLGHFETSLKLYRHMQLEGVQPCAITFLAMLKACAAALDRNEGRRIHHHVIEKRLQSDVKVGTTLIYMYGKCKDLKQARRVFRRIKDRSSVAVWNAMLSAHVKGGEYYNAVVLFKMMQDEGSAIPDRVSIDKALRACSDPSAWNYGKLIYATAAKYGYDIGDTLVGMYIQRGNIPYAGKVFDAMGSKRSCTTFDMMISGLVEINKYEEALQVYRLMQLEGVRLSEESSLSMLKVFTELQRLSDGILLHQRIVASGWDSRRVKNSMVRFYGKCKRIDEARAAFECAVLCKVAAWNCMMAAYVGCGYKEEGLRMFNQMLLEGLVPNRDSYVASLAACSMLRNIERLHNYAIESRLQFTMEVGNALLVAYSECEQCPENLWVIFSNMSTRNVLSWNTMLQSFGQVEEHLENLFMLFENMLLEGIRPNKITFLNLLNAKGNLQLAQAKLVQGLIQECGYASDGMVSSSLMRVYSKLASIEDGLRIFENSIQLRSVEVWNAMLETFIDNGFPQVSFNLFHRMLREVIDPNKQTFLDILKACSSLEEVDIIYAEIQASQLRNDSEIGASLADVISKLQSTTPFPVNS